MPVRIRTVVLLAFWLGGATVARAQVPRGAAADSVARGLGPADSLDLTLRPDCRRRECGHQRRRDSARCATDSLCLTRRAGDRPGAGSEPPAPGGGGAGRPGAGAEGPGHRDPRSPVRRRLRPVDRPVRRGRRHRAERDGDRRRSRSSTSSGCRAGSGRRTSARPSFSAALARQQIIAARPRRPTTRSSPRSAASGTSARPRRWPRTSCEEPRRASTPGRRRKLDVIRAQVDLAQAENDLIANERDVANARAALNRLVGRPLGAPIAAADSLAVPPALPDLDRLEPPPSPPGPSSASLKSQQEGARAATGLAREYWLPDLTVGISHDYADPGPGVLFTGVSLPIPLFFWQHSRGEIAEAHHRELELAAAYRDLEAQVGQDVRARLRGRRHRAPPGRLHPRPAAPARPRGLPHRLGQLWPRRLLGPRAARRPAQPARRGEPVHRRAGGRQRCARRARARGRHSARFARDRRHP